MPTKEIDYSIACSLLNTQPTLNEKVVNTPFGKMILEIQGEFNFSVNNEENTQNEPHNAFEGKKSDNKKEIKIGELIFNDKDYKKVILTVGTSQKMIGTIIDLEMPLALLQIKKQENDHTYENEKSTIKIVDIIKKKIIFKNRPLPVISNPTNEI